MIYEFSDFRAFLAQWHLSEKARRGRFSKAEVSRALGLPNSRSYFTDILAGKSVSETFLERFVEMVGLTGDEAKYFRALVRFQQARYPSARDEAMDQLISLNRSPRTTLSKSQYAYFRHWWHAAVRALLDTDDFPADSRRISSSLQPRITPAQARESIRLLQEMGLVALDDRGYLKPTDKVVSGPEDARDELVLQLQLQQLELVRLSLLDRNAPTRLVATTVLSVSKEAEKRIGDRLEKARSEIRSIAHKDDQPATQVCMAVLSLLPLVPRRSRP